SCPKEKLKELFREFVCGYLAKHARAKYLVKLKEDRSFLRFDGIDEISSLCREYIYKEEKKELNSGLDNFLKMLVLFEKNKSLESVGRGKRYGKEYLEYEVNSSELWHLLTRSYSIKRNSRMRHKNFCANHGEASSDTGLGVSKSDDATVNENHENFPVSHSVPSSEPYSDTGVSQSDDQLIEP
ncbi:Hypothetical predicted protein, partial [Paramuricea clavata]